MDDSATKPKLTKTLGSIEIFRFFSDKSGNPILQWKSQNKENDVACLNHLNGHGKKTSFTVKYL